MKSTVTRFIKIALLTIALFVPQIRPAQAATIPSGGRPGLPGPSSVVSNTNYIRFSNGLTVDSNGTITLSGTSYYANGDTVQYPDGTLVYLDGTIVYPDSSSISIIVS